MATWIDAKDQRYHARITAGGCTPHGMVRFAIYAHDDTLPTRLGRYVGTVELDGDELDLAQEARAAGGMDIVEVPPRSGRPKGQAWPRRTAVTA